MSNIKNNIRYILGQEFMSSSKFSNYLKVNIMNQDVKDDIIKHMRFDFTGNRDTDVSYHNNVELLKLFPDLDINILHDYKLEWNKNCKAGYSLTFHKGQCLFADRYGKQIHDFSGDCTVDILEWLIIYFKLSRYNKTPFEIFNNI